MNTRSVTTRGWMLASIVLLLPAVICCTVGLRRAAVAVHGAAT